MKANDFPSYVTNFFSKYLTLQCGKSPNTVDSYSYAFLLLFRYCMEQRNIDPETLTFEKLSRELVLDFCQWLEDERNNFARTRNSRLSALQSFFRFVEMQFPELSGLCASILSIPLKEFAKKLPVHLSEQEMKILFTQPDTHTKGGIRDLALLTVLFDSGIRISELANLKLGDLHLSGNPGTIKIIRKCCLIRAAARGHRCDRPCPHTHRTVLRSVEGCELIPGESRNLGPQRHGQPALPILTLPRPVSPR